MSSCFKVLCALAAASSLPLSRVGAQPSDVPVNIIGTPQTPVGQPIELPLLPLKVEDFLAQKGGVSRLTLKMEKATADEIAAEVSKQTGIEVLPGADLRGNAENTQRFSVEATGQPFWQAVNQWNRGDTSLHIQRSHDGRTRWSLVTWGTNQVGRDLVAGPCYMVAHSLTLNHSRARSLDPKVKESTTTASLMLQAMQMYDPRFAPLISAALCEAEGAVDDRGRAIALAENYNHPTSPDDNIYFMLNLQQPLADAKSLRSVKGEVRLAVATKLERWELDLTTTPKAEKQWMHGGVEVSYRLDGLTTTEQRTTAKFHITRKTPGPKRSFKAKAQWSSPADLGGSTDAVRLMQFQNALGHGLRAQHTNTRSSEEGDTKTFDIEVALDRDEALKDPELWTPTKIVIDVPLEYREVRFPFEWKNLPLP